MWLTDELPTHAKDKIEEINDLVTANPDILTPQLLDEYHEAYPTPDLKQLIEIKSKLLTLVNQSNNKKDLQTLQKEPATPPKATRKKSSASEAEILVTSLVQLTKKLQKEVTNLSNEITALKETSPIKESLLEEVRSLLAS